MNGEILEALTMQREVEVERIAEMMRSEGFLGISGEALTGKTSLVHRAAALLRARQAARVAVVDLAGAYSIAKLIARWRHQILTVLLGPAAASQVAALPREMWPASTERAALDAREFFGPEFDSALTEHPGKAERPKSYAEAINQTATLAARDGRPLVLVFDHLQAPLLTTRHPVDPHELLWQVRATAQHVPQFHVVVVCAEGSEHIAAARDGAFLNDGSWLRITQPSSEQWAAACLAAGETVDEGTLRLSRGHGPTLLALLAARADGVRDPQAAFKLVAEAQIEHAQRCLMHAASLHRLGAQVLTSLADGDGPYAGTPEARSDVIADAVGELRRGGLIRRDPKDPRGWLLVDPTVRWNLAHPANMYADDPIPEFTEIPI